MAVRGVETAAVLLIVISTRAAAQLFPAPPPPPPPPPAPCTALAIPHSSRASGNPCIGVVGETCSYRCDSGYTRDRTSGQTTCREGGSFEGASCEPISCGGLSDPTNGAVVVADSGVFGSSATYSCNDNYVLLPSRSNVATCEATSRWSIAPPTCAELCQPNTCANGGQCSDGPTHDRRFSCTCPTSPAAWEGGVARPNRYNDNN